jgi:hypothetical protein
MAGIVQGEFFDFAGNDIANSPGGPVGYLLGVTTGRLADLQIVYVEGGGIHPDVVGLAVISPGSIGLEDDAVDIQQGDVSRQRVHDFSIERAKP